MSLHRNPEQHTNDALRIVQICIAGMALTLLGHRIAPGTEPKQTTETQPMDDADRATAQGDTDLARRLAARQRYTGTSATHCADCDKPIPERRRELIAGCTRCALCQGDAERRSCKKDGN